MINNKKGQNLPPLFSNSTNLKNGPFPLCALKESFPQTASASSLHSHISFAPWIPTSLLASTEKELKGDSAFPQLQSCPSVALLRRLVRSHQPNPCLTSGKWDLEPSLDLDWISLGQHLSIFRIWGTTFLRHENVWSCQQYVCRTCRDPWSQTAKQTITSHRIIAQKFDIINYRDNRVNSSIEGSTGSLVQLDVLLQIKTEYTSESSFNLTRVFLFKVELNFLTETCYLREYNYGKNLWRALATQISEDSAYFLLMLHHSSQ